ncbi:peptide deformylase 1 [Candidatus Photodesmus katoptron]|uniref:Peptide deformylase n=1 Tax=Candidatus Photodesmus katoptron Akat1 TaxID=1236703 RepID=S3DID7_9GAMM|nr:peptide deformylase [Candidatus Photodesmus katoptron]EPE37480.1 peptide deformylase [Candidatus Photodesmus katoptron Akat1]KEY90309.1 peptide deformylase 1 [Candidatus Photodesmus katoptron]
MLKVLSFPDIRLRTVAKPVIEVTFEIKEIIDSMIQTMYQKHGFGLAATQVDFHQRIIVIDVSETQNKPLVLINPKIIEKRGEISIEEGCLSIPKITALISRSSEVTIKAMNRNGEKFTFKAHDLLAVCIQHELDHLEGRLFIDYLSPLKRNRVLNKLRKIKRYQSKFS